MKPWFFILVSVAVCRAASAPSNVPDRPNILWLVIEDSSPRHVEGYGDPLARTPTAGRLAAEGVVYDRCYSAPVCAPSRHSLATGRYATSDGAQHMRSTRPLPDGVHLFTMALREAGYYCTNNAKTDYNTSSDWSKAWDQIGDTADWRSRAEGQPFFAMFTFMQSHEEYLQTRHPLKTDPTAVRVPAYLPDAAVIREDIAQNYDIVSAADAAAAQVLTRLEADGLLENTIVFYFADNGGTVAGSKRFLNENGTRVPLMIRFPKKYSGLATSAPGTRNAELVNFVDFAPTVLSLLGVPAPSQFQGRAFAGPNRSAPPAFTYMYRDRMDERYDLIRAVTDGRYRYIRNYHPDRPLGQHIEFLWKQATMAEWDRQYRSGNLNSIQRSFFEPKSAEELYDLDADPDNVRNLASDGAHLATLVRFRKALRDHILAVRDTGFMPESLMVAQSGSKSPAVLAANEEVYPLAKLVEVIDSLELGDPSLEELITACHDRAPVMRYWAAAAAAARPSFVGPEVAKLLEDSCPEVRLIAAEAMLRLGSNVQAIQVIDSILAQEQASPELRLAGLNALQRTVVEVPESLRSEIVKLSAIKDASGPGNYLARAAKQFLVTLSTRRQTTGSAGRGSQRNDPPLASRPENIKWDALNDPIFSGPDDDMVKDPSVFEVNGTYYMYYTGALPGFQGGGTDWQLEYATSKDGTNWQKQGILFKADKDTWEAGRVQAPSRAIWHDGKYYMFYTGGPRRPKNLIYTGYATSTDLVNWKKVGTIQQNVERANDIFIYEEGGSFCMFYTTYGLGGHEPIMMRRSPDLLNWSDPEPTGAEGEGTIVWQENQNYFLLGAHGYSGNGEKYHLFTSKALNNFTELGIVDMAVPAFASGAFGHGDVLTKGGEEWFFFQGTRDGGKTFKIGLAKHKLAKK